MPEDLRLFQLHQTQTGARAPSINGSVAALRFFFTVTLDRPEMARHLTFVREPRRIPVILSLEEIARLLEAAPGPKSKAALSAAYGAGLRSPKWWRVRPSIERMLAALRCFPLLGCCRFARTCGSMTALSRRATT